MKMKLYHTEVLSMTISNIYEAGDDKAEIKRLLSKLVNHYLEDTATPRERQIQAQLLFIDLSTSLADAKTRQTACPEILKNILLGVLIPK